MFITLSNEGNGNQNSFESSSYTNQNTEINKIMVTRAGEAVEKEESHSLLVETHWYSHSEEPQKAKNKSAI